MQKLLNIFFTFFLKKKKIFFLKCKLYLVLWLVYNYDCLTAHIDTKA